MPSIGEFTGAMSAQFSTSGLTGMMTPFAEFVTSFTAQLKQIIGPFEKLTDLVSHFVGHLDPTIVEDLGRKFRDLNATVGVALRPILDVTREIVKNLSDHLLPIMKQLEPIVKEIAEVVGGALNQSIEEMSTFIDTFMPTLHALKEVVVGVVKIAQDLWSVFVDLSRTLTDVFMSIFGKMGDQAGAVRKIMEDLRSAIQTVITNLIMFAARLMMSFGWTKGVESMIKGFTAMKPSAKEESGGLAVALNSAFKSIGDLAKSAQLEAFRASAAGTKPVDPAAQSAEFLGKIKTSLEDLLRAGQSEESPIIKRIQRVVDFLEKEIVPAADTVSKFVKEKAIPFVTTELPERLKKIDVAISKVKGLIDDADSFAKGIKNLPARAIASVTGARRLAGVR